ncbi:MAG: hypothetical protein ACI8QG_002375, partial [Flavobacteriales bacterium]
MDIFTLHILTLGLPQLETLKSPKNSEVA